jgi:hypothetical protein
MKPVLIILGAIVIAGCYCRPTVDRSAESSGKLYPFQSNGKIGFTNALGTVVVRPQYDDTADFSCGLARVNIGGKPVTDEVMGLTMIEGGKWGYIDSTGRRVTDISFNWASDFSDGYGRVSDGNRSTHFIDTNGSCVLSFEKRSFGNFTNGLALAQPIPNKAENQPLYGYINSEGGWHIPPRYNGASDFELDIAIIHYGGEYWPGDDTWYEEDFEGGEWQVIDTSGRSLMKTKDYWKAKEFANKAMDRDKK